MKRFSRITLLVVLGALLLPVLSQMAQVPGDNPLKNAKVGEWIEYVMKTGAMGQTTEMKMKQTVVAKDATSVTLRSETTMMGNKMPPQDTKIPLNTPYEPYKQGLTGVVVTPMGTGSETITVGGKPYACTWTKVKTVVTTPQAMESITKVWTCPSVPVTRVVKMETASTMAVAGNKMNTTMTMELTGAGAK